MGLLESIVCCCRGSSSSVANRLCRIQSRTSPIPTFGHRPSNYHTSPGIRTKSMTTGTAVKSIVCKKKIISTNFEFPMKEVIKDTPIGAKSPKEKDITNISSNPN
jgi:hypothetical protein